LVFKLYDEVPDFDLNFDEETRHWMSEKVCPYQTKYVNLIQRSGGQNNISYLNIFSDICRDKSFFPFMDGLLYNLTHLTHLDLSRNFIIGTTINKLSNLTYLNIGGNKVTDLRRIKGLT